MNDNINTPMSTTEKRYLSSSEELASKKNKIDTEFSENTNTNMAATNINLDADAIHSIAAALTCHRVVVCLHAWDGREYCKGGN